MPVEVARAPMVWIRLRSERRKPSLSASRIATSETSGMSRPSRSRLIPTSTSRAQPQVTDDFHAFDGIDIGMQITHADAVLAQEVGQILGHALGERGHKHALRHRHPGLDLAQQVVDLGARRQHLHLRIHQTRGTHHLLHHVVRMLALIGGRRGGHEHALAHARFKFLQLQRPVIQRRRQAESILDQRFLARPVAAIHGAQLPDGDVAFIDEHQRIAGQIVDQCGRRLAWRGAR